MPDIFTNAALVLMCSFEIGLLQVVKLSPQPHEPFEFGLLNVNSDLHISTSCDFTALCMRSERRSSHWQTLQITLGLCIPDTVFNKINPGAKQVH